jgi:O-antigen ligase
MARRIHLWCLIAVIALAPLPLGSNRPLAWSFLGLAVGILCLAWPLVAGRQNKGAVMPAWVPMAFGGAIGWAYVQSLPGLGAEVPLWVAAAHALTRAQGPEVSASFSVDPEATRTGILRLLTYGGVFWLTVQHGQLSRRPYRITEALAVVAMIYAGYGLIEYVSGGETILGMPKWAYIGDLTSTFVNRNSYATFAGLGLLCCVSAAARRLEDRRAGLAPLLMHLRRRTALFLVGGLAVLVALLCTGSRAGIVASLLGLTSLVLCLWIGGGGVRRPFAYLVFAVWALTILVAAGLLIGSNTFEIVAFDRALVYRLTLSAITDRPLTGSGLGSFPATFAALRPPSLVLPWREAHDTYLELMLELGIPATLCLLAPVVWAMVRCLSGLLRPGSQTVSIALGAAATVLVGTHAVVDFSAQIPAITIFWLALLGTGAAQVLQRAPSAQRDYGALSIARD